MSEYDPDEMVKFDNRDRTLLSVVHDIMSQPATRRIGIAVFRAEGLTPSVYEVADIEKMAELPEFKEQGHEP